MLHNPATASQSARRSPADRGQGRKPILHPGLEMPWHCRFRTTRGRQIWVGVRFLKLCAAAYRDARVAAAMKPDSAAAVKKARKKLSEHLNEARPHPFPLDADGRARPDWLTPEQSDENTAHFANLRARGLDPLETYPGLELRHELGTQIAKAMRKPGAYKEGDWLIRDYFQHVKYGYSRIALELAAELSRVTGANVSDRLVKRCGTWVIKRRPKRMWARHNGTIHFYWKGQEPDWLTVSAPRPLRGAP